MYWDLASTSVEEAELLAASFARPNTDFGGTGAGIQATSQLSIPSEAHLRVETTNDSGSVDSFQCTTNSSPMNTLDAASKNVQGEPSKPSSFLELCINTGQFQRDLGEINITKMDSDGELFEAIADTYYIERARRTSINLRIPKYLTALLPNRPNRQMNQWAILKPSAVIFRKVRALCQRASWAHLIC